MTPSRNNGHILDVVVLAGRGSARASEDRGAWLKAGAARGFVPIRHGLLFRIFWMPWSWGSLTTRRRGTVGGAQRRSRRLILTVLRPHFVFVFVFVFSLGGPTPSEAAGGRPLTQKSKKLGLGRSRFISISSIFAISSFMTRTLHTETGICQSLGARSIYPSHCRVE